MMSLCEVIPCLSHIMKCSPDACAIGADELAAGISVSSVGGIGDAGAGCSGAVTDKAPSPSAAVEGGSMPIIVSRSSITSGVLAVSRGGTGNTVEVDGAVVSLAEGEASRPDGSGLATPVDSPTVRSAASLVSVMSITTVPEKRSGRSPDSHISAGDKRKKVKVFDQPLSLVTVAFQIALFSGVGCSMPWSCSTLNTDVLFAGMPSIP